MTPDDQAAHPAAEIYRGNVTWGRLLEDLSRRRVAALAPQFPWARPLGVALTRAEELSRNHAERFTRVERMPTDDPRGQLRPATMPRPGDVEDQERGRAPRPDRPRADAPPEPPGAGAAPTVTPEVPPTVRDRLRRIVGPAADLMQVHTGPGADALARAAGADAVTVGRDVHLRQGRYAPYREEGVALLAHEATHVVRLLEPNPGWLGDEREHAEEALARHRERDILGVADRPPSRPTTPAAPPTGSPTVPNPPSAPGPHAAAHPLAAAAHAPSIRSPSSTAGAAGPTAPPARAAASDRDLTGAQEGPDLDTLRRSVIADVMRQLRTEFERGG